MSTTSTSTTSYILVSYRYQQDKPGIIRPSVPKDEWKIYQTSLPSSLRLVLETTKTSSGRWTSVVMKIMDIDETRPGGPITLDTIDFLDFSTPEIAKLASPLKAVVGGKQLGFRYLHPLKADAAAQYHKRLQLTFTSGEDARALVASIRHVCPTSDSQQVGSVKPPQRSKITANPMVSTLCTQPQTQGHPNASRAPVLNPAQMSSSPVDIQMDEPIRNPPFSPENRNSTFSPSTARTADFQAPFSASQFNFTGNKDSILPSSQPNASQTHQMERTFTNGRMPPVPAPTPPIDPLDAKAPSSGTNFSSILPLARDIQISTPDPSPRGPTQTTLSQIHMSGMSSDEADIHKLSAYELEMAVAQVVHEPGFPDLMEKLDKMYALKGFIKF